VDYGSVIAAEFKSIRAAKVNFTRPPVRAVVVVVVSC